MVEIAAPGTSRKNSPQACSHSQLSLSNPARSASSATQEKGQGSLIKDVYSTGRETRAERERGSAAIHRCAADGRNRASEASAKRFVTALTFAGVIRVPRLRFGSRFSRPSAKQNLHRQHRQQHEQAQRNARPHPPPRHHSRMLLEKGTHVRRPTVVDPQQR